MLKLQHAYKYIVYALQTIYNTRYAYYIESDFTMQTRQ